MGAVMNAVVGARVILRYPPPCPVRKYITRYTPYPDSYWFTMMFVCLTSTAKVDTEVSETAHAGWLAASKRELGHWNDLDFLVFVPFTEMRVVTFIEEGKYERSLRTLVCFLCEKSLVSSVPWLLLWCGSDRFVDQWHVFYRKCFVWHPNID